MPDYTNKTRAS